MFSTRIILSTNAAVRPSSRRILQTSHNVISKQQQQQYKNQCRLFTDKTAKDAAQAKSSGGGGSSSTSSSEGPGWWRSPEFWGGLGAIAGWGMSGAAIYDANQQGPEVISLTMTPVLMVYSTLFARWAWVVQPRNLLLMWCHITNVAAQSNQLRRALEYKKANGQEKEVNQMLENVAKFGAVTAVAVAAGPKIRSVLTNANLGVISSVSAAPAGPFTVHFW
jgi:mitochondrial pyruvate carrier 1